MFKIVHIDDDIRGVNHSDGGPFCQTDSRVHRPFEAVGATEGISSGVVDGAGHGHGAETPARD